MPSFPAVVRSGLFALALSATLLAQSWVQRVSPATPSPRNRAAATHDLYRGGSWALNDTAASCMSAARNSLAFEFLGSNTLGFRIVLAPIRNP
jgi:formylglycine-generating enzyme required for sulfatase activity